MTSLGIVLTGGGSSSLRPPGATLQPAPPGRFALRQRSQSPPSATTRRGRWQGPYCVSARLDSPYPQDGEGKAGGGGGVAARAPAVQVGRRHVLCPAGPPPGIPPRRRRRPVPRAPAAKCGTACNVSRPRGPAVPHAAAQRRTRTRARPPGGGHLPRRLRREGCPKTRPARRPADPRPTHHAVARP